MPESRVQLAATQRSLFTQPRDQTFLQRGQRFLIQVCGQIERVERVRALAEPGRQHQADEFRNRGEKFSRQRFSQRDLRRGQGGHVIEQRGDRARLRDSGFVQQARNHALNRLRANGARPGQLDPPARPAGMA